MLRENIKHIDGIFFTHEHADHSAGMDDIRPFYFKQGDIPIFGTERVIKNFTERFNYIFSKENKYPGAPSVNINIVSAKKSFEFKGKEIIPIEVMHNNLSILGYRIDNFCYLTDVKTIPDQELNKLKNIDLLVLSCLRIDEHPNHLNLKEAEVLINKLKPNRCYLTHISHLMGFHKIVNKKLAKNVFLAYDTLRIKSH